MGFIIKQYEVQATRIPGIKIAENKITSSQTVAEITRKLLGRTMLVRETSYLFLLNRNNRIVGVSKIAEGGISHTIMETRLILKTALDVLSSAVIIVHNHPSGTIEPSRADNSVTDKIKKSLEMIDVQLIDHVIVTEQKHYSYADEGKL